jgi:quercetin dioxygenase-like cupin family protein
MPVENRKSVVLAPGHGRSYPMGRLSAVFKADGAETAGAYSISEWWLEPHTQGPGAHSHPEDDVFYVVAGVMSFYLEDRWIDAPRGSFVLVPGGTTHDFENRSALQAGVLNFSAPGNFEPHMPAIAEWFHAHPPGPAGE